MKIEGENTYIKLDAYLNNVKDKQTTDTSVRTVHTETVKEDKVVLSPEVREFQRAKKLIGSIPDVRDEKVAMVKKEIEAGTYQIDGKKIAHKMIKESLLNELA
ncbi:MAG: flagellar biosynthesis anti-sigma factor FlgM [Deltaproteobacteria bacterium]|nr:flagellar biosynthesis anti-sigma factor FlgM [Deltaproteobacteria bacterium]